MAATNRVYRLLLLVYGRLGYIVIAAGLVLLALAAASDDLRRLLTP